MPTPNLQPSRAKKQKTKKHALQYFLCVEISCHTRKTFEYFERIANNGYRLHVFGKNEVEVGSQISTLIYYCSEGIRISMVYPTVNATWIKWAEKVWTYECHYNIMT